ncbi:hypothetical protein UY3_11754 [Chelonia mydas]|uniref:Uncharacterized protein n=1 Tax=Chelonia mydas TaxID=8469 RepID=M7B6A2_CHEMY|nr:hypothetical protein UY3_11754 [Chelonia mydas]
MATPAETAVAAADRSPANPMAPRKRPGLHQYSYADTIVLANPPSGDTAYPGKSTLLVKLCLHKGFCQYKKITLLTDITGPSPRSPECDRQTAEHSDDEQERVNGERAELGVSLALV